MVDSGQKTIFKGNTCGIKMMIMESIDQLGHKLSALRTPIVIFRQTKEAVN